MGRNNVVSMIATLALLGVLLVGCAPAPKQSIQPASTPGVSDALRQDAESMAKDMGIPVEEAIRRLLLQDSIGTLGAQLEQQEAETFAGLWIQNEPEYRVIAAFTRDGQATIKPYIENTPFEELVEVRKAEVPLADLETVQQKVMRIVQELGFPFSSEINIQENRVELQVTDQALWEAALQQAHLQIPEHVEVLVIYEPLGTDLPFVITPVAHVFMPQLKVRSAGFMDALLQGELIVEDGCLRVSHADASNSALVIWQPDYFLNDNNGRIEIWNREGQVIARVGEEIKLGGGSASLATFSSQLREPVPGQCKGPYWLMGEVVPEK
jgi:hypothetical protein